MSIPAIHPSDIAGPGAYSDRASPSRITVHPLPQTSRTQAGGNGPAQTSGSHPTQGARNDRAGAADTSWGGDGFGFDDFLDLINPLQHIPIVSMIYREISGDQIAPEAQIIGGAVIGGVVGLASAAVNVIVEQESGRDIGEHMVALWSDPASETQQVASADSVAPVVTPPLSSADSAKSAKKMASARPEELLSLDDLLLQTGSKPAKTSLPSLPALTTLSPNAMEAFEALQLTAPVKAARADPDISTARSLKDIENISPDKPAQAVIPAPAPRAASGTKPAASNNPEAGDMILELFGADLSAAQDQYRKAQGLSQMLEVQSRIKA